MERKPSFRSAEKLKVVIEMSSFQSEPIFLPGTQPFEQCHASTIVETGDGRLLAAWFGGTHEGHPDVAIWLSERRDARWGSPVKIAGVPGVPLWNPVLFRDSAGAIWLFYKTGLTIPEWTGAYIQSEDHGVTWSEPTYLPAGLLGPAKNKPMILSNGDILCGTSAETWQSWSCWVEISSDGGASWQRRGPITVPSTRGEPGERVSAAWDAASGSLALPDSFAGVIQPTVWEYAPGRLKMLMRATRRVGFICESLSDDYGQTWMPARPTDLPNPNSGLDAVRLVDGRIALAYNPSPNDRFPLAVAISADNGQTWPRQRILEGQPGEFSYPAIIQAADGRLHLTYTNRRNTIQHVILDQNLE